MDLQELKTLITKGESETLEFKKSTGLLETAGKTLCGFLNQSGGIILFGVSDKKDFLGQQISDKTIRDINHYISMISPMPTVDIHYIVLKGDLQIIAINAITDSTKRPYLFNNQAYIRRGSSTYPMPRDYLQHLVIASVQGNHRWEEGIIHKATMDDLDHEEILKTIRDGITNRRIPEDYVTESAEEALIRFKLIEDHKLKNAAVILFGTNPDRWFPQCLLKLARFKGTEKNEMMDSRHVYGNAFQLLREALIFADRHIPIKSTFPKDQIERIDKPLISVNALREIFANAIVHRDYSLAGGSISFALFDDRIEVWNYGSLMSGLPYNQLKDSRESVPRNPLIANIFYYRKLFESWGRGIKLIFEECLASGLPEPDFSERSGGFCIALQTKVDISVTMPKEAYSLQIGTLSIRQQEIIKLLEHSEEMTLKDIMNSMQEPTPVSTLQDDLSKLKNATLIELIGFGRGSRWRLPKE